MDKIITFIKDFFKDSKKRLIFIISAVAVVAAIILICVLASSRIMPEEKPAATPAPLATTPAPTPTEELPTPTVTEASTPTSEPEEPTPTELPSQLEPGKTYSVLDGSIITEEQAKMRPYCIMFNNIKAANPQSGTGDAKILYEALVEGSITRMMGVFEGLDENSSCKDRIGSVRSARHYYASVADEYDAIFIHYGETVYATRKISELKLDHLEGTYGEGSTVYYRDKSIKAPHNAFASLEGIHKGIKMLGIREEHRDSFEPQHFVFGETVLPDTAKNATKVTLDFSSYTKPYFTYDESTKLYKRFQFDGEHIDYNTGEQLTFTNIIIQVVKEWDKDKNGYQDMELADAEGHGYYITGGKCVEITWKKNEKKKTCMYYDADGNVLTINPGKTFIALYPNFREDKLGIE